MRNHLGNLGEDYVTRNIKVEFRVMGCESGGWKTAGLGHSLKAYSSCMIMNIKWFVMKTSLCSYHLEIERQFPDILL
jgi:hypothetical protein